MCHITAISTGSLHNIRDREEFMKTTEKYLRVGFVLTLLTLAVPLIIMTMMTQRVGANGQSTQQDDHGKSVAPELEGSWRLVVTPSDQPVAYFRETYSRGGGYVNSGLTDAVNGDSTSQGTWVRTGPNQFTATHERFIKFNPLTGHPGIRKIQQVILVNGDTYTGVGDLWFCAPTGEDCVNIPGSALIAGTRMTAQ
jgi:hypothetical protein